MAREEWTQLRITRRTRARLDVFMQRLQHAYDLGATDGNDRSDKTITVDYALNVLLLRDECKRQRAAKSRSRTKRADGPPETIQPAD